MLIERYPTLGGVCLNVGCIPSKALLHVAKVITEADELAHNGITFGKPKIEIDKLRTWKDGVLGKLTKGLSALAKQRKVEIVQGKGEFTTPNTIRVETKDGVKTVSFDHCIVAAGSSVARIPGFPYDDPRLIDSTGALTLPEIPKRLRKIAEVEIVLRGIVGADQHIEMVRPIIAGAFRKHGKIVFQRP